MGLRIERVVTSGIFSLDGEDFDVDNNIWLIGDDHEVVVVDAAHDHRPIAEAVRGRRTLGVLCTHGHNDHINAAVELADAVDAPRREPLAGRARSYRTCGALPRPRAPPPSTTRAPGPPPSGATSSG